MMQDLLSAEAVFPLPRLHKAIHRMLEALAPDQESRSPLLGDLPLVQMRCLYLIEAHGEPRLADVARQMHVSLPSVSRAMDRLVRDGLVDRNTDPRDRRAVRLKLTERAQALLAEERRSQQASLASYMHSLAPDEIETVIHGLTLLASAAEQAKAMDRGLTPPFPQE